MTELERIAADLQTPGAAGVPVLATLMSVAGSAYRGPGARMVVRGEGTTAGQISGGCLEKDVVAHAERARAAGAAQVVTYDLTRDDDAPWGLNMGCNAKLDVLLEPCAAGVPEYLTMTLAALAARNAVVISTAFAGGQAGGRSGGQQGLAAGDRALMIGNDAPVTGALAEGPIGAAVRLDANRVMDEERSDVVSYPHGDATIQVLHEFVARPIRLVICGEGNDVEPLVRLGTELAWRVTLVGKDDALPAADARTAAVVMTHNYARDVALMAQLFKSRAGYIGLLGPKTRTERLIKDLTDSDRAPNFAELLRLHAPVGLDIGAETPEEVALAITAEVRAVMAARAGGKLRDRKGPIHERR